MSNPHFAPSEPSTAVEKAVEKLKAKLTPKEQREFKACTLKDVLQTVDEIQERQGNQKNLRGLAKIQSFLEAMEQYRTVVEAFLNCTPFLGYVWVRSLHSLGSWIRS